MGLKIENKNKELAIYLMENKDLRVWQNLQNFFSARYLLTAEDYDPVTNTFVNIKDMFYSDK